MVLVVMVVAREVMLQRSLLTMPSTRTGRAGCAWD